MADYKDVDADGKVRIPFEWQPIGAGGELGPNNAFRVPVVGGWLISTSTAGSFGLTQAVAFVPDPEHRWTPVPPGN